MDDLEKKLSILSREVSQSYLLKKEERSRMLENIFSDIYHVAAPSPYQRVKFPHFFFMNYASLTLLAVFLLTGAISYSAEQSLPGDPLYSVKTDFNENIQSLLTFSPESKAKLEAALAEKRLVEAQKLAVSGDLSTADEVALNKNFSAHSDQFKKSVAAIGNNQDPATAAALSSDYQSALEAHQNVLKTLSSTASGSVSANVSSQISDLDVVRKQAEESIASSSPDEIKNRAYDTLDQIYASIDRLGNLSDKLSANDGDASVSIQAHITNAESIIDEGMQGIESDNYTAAFISFQTALRELREAELTIQTANNLGLDDAQSKKVLSTIGPDISSDASSTLPIDTSSATTTATSTVNK